VVALAIVLEQFHGKAREQPQGLVVVLAQQARHIAKGGFCGHHVVQHPAPGLPAVVQALAAHGDGDFDGGAGGHGS